MLPVVNLKDAKAGYGGKAAGLSRLFSYKVPVPDGFALSPDFVDDIASDTANEKFLANLGGINKEKKYAVRSSALNEDGAENSFAGIYDTILNVSGDPAEIVKAIKKIHNGQNSSRAASYRSERNVDDDKHSQLGIVIQEMIAPVIAGVAFTSALGVDGKQVMLFECVEGLADKLVSGEVTPTRIEIPLKADGSADIAGSVVTGSPLNMTGFDRLADFVSKSASEAKTPLDVEWAIDDQGKPWLLQARPVTKNVLVPVKSSIQAVPASSGLAKASAFVVESDQDLEKFPDGAVLVAKVTETDYLPAMRRAAAVITEEGGILSHAAIVSREMGIPCIVGYADARKYFPTGTVVTVDGTSGNVTNHSDPEASSGSVEKLDVDWGAAYLFEELAPIQIGNVTGLFDPTPAGLALHVPDEISSEVDNEFEIFSRKNFGQSPRRYQSDKYLWYFEWKRFQNSEFFLNNLHESLAVIDSFDADAIGQHYSAVVEHSKQLVGESGSFDDPASRFLLEETLLTSHFLLTMLIPEGYALKAMYAKAQPLLAQQGLTFSDLLANQERVGVVDPELNRIMKFSQSVSGLRNEIYDKLLEENIMRDEYFDDRTERAAAAVASMGIECSPDEDPVSVFYREIDRVPGRQRLQALSKKNLTGLSDKPPSERGPQPG